MLFYILILYGLACFVTPAVYFLHWHIVTA